MTNNINGSGIKIPYQNITEINKNQSIDEIEKSVKNNGKSEIAIEDKDGKRYLISSDNININKQGKSITLEDIFDDKNIEGKKILFSDIEKKSEGSPVKLDNNIQDPANIDARYQMPEGLLPMSKTTADPNKLPWDKSLDEFAKNLGTGDDLINNVSAVADKIDYKPNTNADNAFRRPVGGVWDGLKTHGECSDIHNIATYLLNQNGVEAYTVQIGRTSGPHNVTIFKDKEGKYDIMEYGKVYQANGESPEDAMRKIQNDRLGTVYRYVIYKPTKDDFEVRSIGQGREAAVFDNFTSTPNLGFNHFAGGTLNTTGMYAGSDGIQLNAPGGFKLTSQMRNGELQNIGIGKFDTNKDGVTSGFSVIHDKPSNMTVGQYQRFTDQYKWLSAGVMYHSPLSSVSTLSNGEKGQVNMPTLIPFFGGSYGGEKNLIKNENLRLSVNGFIQGRIVLPFLMTEEGRKITEHAQNGNVPFMDFGQVLGMAQLKTGTGANLEFSPWKVGNGQLQLGLGYKAKYEVVDPTLIYRDPTAFLSNTGTIGLKYDTPVGKDMNLSARLTGQITDSKFVYEQNRVDASVMLKNNNDKWGVGLNGAATQTGFSAGANGFYMFNDKTGLMGGVNYDSTSSYTNPNGTGLNIGGGIIQKF